MKKILSLALALTMLLALFGCAKGPEVPESSTPETPESSVPEVSESSEQEEPSQGKTIACCMGSIDHPVHRVVQYGFFTKAEELGMKPIVSGPSVGGSYTILEIMDIWERDIAQNSVAGVLMWVGDDSCYEMMKGLKKQGIYVVTACFPHKYKDTKDFIDKSFVNYYEEYGKAAADFLVDRLIENGIEEGAIGWGGDVGGSGGSMGSSHYFTERIKELNTPYTLCSGRFEGVEVQEATQKMTEYIKEYPDMVGAFGSMHEAWVAAKEANGRDDLIVVARNYYPNISEALQSGAIAGAVDPLRVQLGEQSAQALGDLISGKVFNGSEESWCTTLESPVVYFGGEGEQSLTALDEIYAKAVEYFK